MNKSFWLKAAVLTIAPLVLFWFAYRVRADQKRTLFTQYGVEALALVDGGKKLAISTGSLSGFSLWDVPNRKLISQQGYNSKCRVNGQLFDTGVLHAHFSLAAQMEVRDVQTGEVVRTADCSKEIEAKYSGYEELRGGTLSNEGKFLALSTWTPPSDNSKKFPSVAKLRLWDLQTHQPICVIEAADFPQELNPGDYHIAPIIRSVRFAPDDETVAVGLDDGSVSLWNARDGQLKYRLKEQDDPIVALAFSSDGKMLASGSMNNEFYRRRGSSNIVIWNAMQGKRLHIFNQGFGATALTFSPDGKTLASGDDEGGAALWSVVTGELEQRLNGHREQITGLDFSPDGKMLATGSHDKRVKLWDLN